MSCRVQARNPAPVGAPRVESAATVLASFLSDAAHVSGGVARGIVFPCSAAETAAAVATAPHVLPIGAQSSLTGGATPRGELIVSTRALTAIEILDRHHVQVGAGVPLAHLQQQLAGRGLYYPPAPTYDGAFVGGTIATNAAGAATFKYGSTRHWVDAITVVLANGTVLDLVRGTTIASAAGMFEVMMPDGSMIEFAIPRYSMPRVPKLSAGYHAAAGMDLVDLFIGSEGTLGVVTGAVLRVIDRPTTVVALITCDNDHHAVAVTNALRAQAHLAWAGRGALDVSAVEYMDARSLRAISDVTLSTIGIDRPRAEAVMLLVQMETGTDPGASLTALGEVLEAAGVVDDPLVAGPGDDRGAQRFFELREEVPASVNRLVARAKERENVNIEKTAGDLIVPFDRLETALEMYRLRFAERKIDYAIWGHMSDGNLHVNVIPQTLQDVIAGREVLIDIAREVMRVGGAPLAEHGVGRSPMKQRLLRELYGDEGIEQMRAVKRALDPGWKLSPGVLFPAPGQE